MRYKLNIQNFAPAMSQVTINFDSNIAKVALILDEETITYEWTTSGQTSDYLAFIDGTDYTFEVTLNNDYVLDTVTLLGNELQGTLKSKTNDSFVVTAGSGAIGNIALTSKQSSSTTGINKLRLESKTPVKYYLGSKELFKMYLGNKIVYQKQSMPQLATPQNLAVENTTLSFDEVENAESYEVFVDNVSIGSYQVSKGEKWVLNETIKLSAQTFTTNFVSNGQNFNSLKLTNTILAYDTTQVYAKFVPEGSNWVEGEAYRTITFDSPVTDSALLTWLQANGVKQ